MTLSIEAIRVPLSDDPDGVVRVACTRGMIDSDSAVASWPVGATAEEIVQQYSTLGLADVYSAIGYYLSRQAEVDEYLSQRGQQADAVRRENEARFSPQGVRERLMARRADAGR